MPTQRPARIIRSSSVGRFLFTWFNAFLHGAESALEQIVIGSGAAELLQRLGEYFETLLWSYRVHDRRLGASQAEIQGDSVQLVVVIAGRRTSGPVVPLVFRH